MCFNFSLVSMVLHWRKLFGKTLVFNGSAWMFGCLEGCLEHLMISKIMASRITAVEKYAAKTKTVEIYRGNDACEWNMPKNSRGWNMPGARLTQDCLPNPRLHTDLTQDCL